METEQYHHGDQIKGSENLDQDVVGRQLNNMTHKNILWHLKKNLN